MIKIEYCRQIGSDKSRLRMTGRRKIYPGSGDDMKISHFILWLIYTNRVKNRGSIF